MRGQIKAAVAEGVEGERGKQMSNFGIIALTPANCPEALHDPSIALASAKAGGTGVINAEFGCEATSLASAVDKILPHGECGIKCGIDQIELFEPALRKLGSSPRSNVLILTPGAVEYTQAALTAAVQNSRSLGLRVFVEVISLSEALLAESAAPDAIVVKGHEAAGRVGDDTTFVLVQMVLKHVCLPVWAEGGVGLQTAAALYAAGVAGVVLDAQLLLTRESPLAAEVKAKIARLDGSESLTSGGLAGEAWRFWARPGFAALEKLSEELRAIEDTAAGGNQASLLKQWRAAVRRHIDSTSACLAPGQRLWPLGQDVAFALPLARKYQSVASIIHALRTGVQEQLAQAAALKSLDENSPLAAAHGSRYPIVQGAMTRVSDTAEFAYSVSSEGALPFLALALMRGDEIDRLLNQCGEKLKGLPWGVGILGFVPQQLRQEQLSVIERHKPPFALIAGGRPDQARALEDLGITTYLHVPSPLLLKSFIELGSRRFIFEGKECGGHVGPRSSFVLWQQMIDVLLASIAPKEDASTYHIVFAGGIHDHLSAAMVGAMAAPLAARGVRVGVLMGTAYLFTEEAVKTGAIVKKFQEAALACERTVLLETGPGHAIRCIESPYKQVFDDHRHELEGEGRNRNEVREELELMNLGRLRIASKGLARRTNADTGVSDISAVSDDEQWADGMYMIGQVAALHERTTTIANLHRAVSRDASAYLAKKAGELSSVTVLPARPAQEPIAIIGMSGIFPKASHLEMFWENILNKVDAVVEIPKDYWDWEKFYDPNPLARDKIYSKWGGFLPEIPFDASRYGIPPSTITAIDPMQLLILEATRAALIDAGYLNREFPRERTSVLLANAGHGPVTAFFSLRSMLDWVLSDIDPAYRKQLEQRLPEWSEDVFPGYLGNVTAGRVANRFDLGGINFSIDAACASSLAALYVGVRDLRAYASDVVLLSATDTHNQPGDYLSFSKVHALSRQGRCRTFDASADGIVISEAIAMLVLKRLSDAERDGDRVYAVIKGIGGSSDGRDLSLTAPRPAGQVLALRRAYEDAGVSPATVGLVEAHGTGTVAGDKAEVEALRQVFDAAGAERRSCAIGSVKTMIGHTKCAAGLASIIKVAKALHHKVLPPTLGVETPNPTCDFENSPFHINAETRPWVNGAGSDRPRRAGVSAFGFGGTNFHIVLEEYTADFKAREAPAKSTWPSELFLMRGANAQSLARAVATLEDSLDKALNTPHLPDSPVPAEGRPTLQSLAVSWHMSHASERRAAGELCLAIVASSLADLKEKLVRARQSREESDCKEIKDPRGIYFCASPIGRDKKVAALFPGQGSQQVDMLRDLSVVFPEIRESFEKADTVLSGCFDRALSRFVYPPPAFTADDKQRQQAELTDTHVAQPAVGAAALAAWRIFRSLGLTPDMVAGHSFGEYIALHAAGSLSEDNLLLLAEQRGRILAKTDGQRKGTMAAVNADASLIGELLRANPGVVLANVNAPNQCIISGDEQSVAEAVRKLEERQMRARLIPVSAAFHSPLMEPAKAELEGALKEFTFASPQIAVYSNTHACPYPDAPESFAARLADHLVKPVQFLQEIEEMYAQGAGIFIEVGPGSVLTNLVDNILDGRPHIAISVDRAGRNGITQLQHAIAQLAANGVAIDAGPLFRRRAGDLLEAAATHAENAPPEAASRKKLTYLIDSTRIRRLTGSDASAKVQPLGSVQGDAKQTAAVAVAAPVQTKILPAATAPERASTATSQGDLGAPAAMAAASTSKQPSVGNKGLMDQKESNGQKPTVAAQGLAPLKAASHVAPPAGNRSSGSPVQAATAKPAPAPALQKSIQRSSRDQVMIEFQRTMLEMTNSFLQAQQQVMLAYLQGNGSLDPQALASLTQAMQASAQPSAAPAPLYAMPAAAAQIEPYRQGNGHDPGLEQLPVAPVAAPAQPVTGLAASPAAPASQLAAETSGQDPASQAGPAEPPNDSAALDADFLISSLLEIVSDRTGYPPDMLDPNLDLEADLGIDSIKRVEILNNFRKLLPDSRQQQLEGGLEKLAGIKTLQGIMDWIRLDLTAEGAPSPEQPAPVAPPAAADEPLPGKSIVARGLVKAVILPEPQPSKLPNQGVILITGDGAGLADALALQLLALEHKVVLAGHDRSAPEAGVRRGDNLYSLNADLSSETGARALVEQVVNDHGQISGLIHLVGLNADDDTSSSRPLSLYSLFHLSRSLDTVRSFKETDGTFVVAATGLGGVFASSLEKGASFDPRQAGIVGFMKSLAREWPGIRTKAVDLDPAATIDEQVAALLAEAGAADEHVEVGYKAGRRYRLEVKAAKAEAGAGSDPIALDSSSVILVTGGARGITAEICLELAEKYHPTFVIAGRVPRPDAPEPAETAALESAKDLKAGIMESLRKHGKPVSIPAVEASYQKLLREREVRRNLEALEKLGSTVRYYSVDVREPSAFGELIDRLYDSYGRIDGVIHGAGVIEDNLIQNKPFPSFDRVFQTKVSAALTLSRKLQLQTLKFLFFFSSVVGRTGNAGQSDYVAANEVLSKLAVCLDQKSPGRVSSLMWGPWKGGMAQPELEAIFARHGWAMIEPADGRRTFIEELTSGKKGEVEVLLVGKPVDDSGNGGTTGASSAASTTGNSTGLSQGGTNGADRLDTKRPGPVSSMDLVESDTRGARLCEATVTRPGPGQVEFTVALNRQQDLYLNDHTFDGIPVMPMAMAAELMAEAAAAAYPGWTLSSIHSLDIPAGIVFDTASKDLTVVLDEEARTSDLIKVRLAVVAGPRRRSHFRACAELAPGFTAAASPNACIPHEYAAPQWVEAQAVLPTRSEIYQKWLFHGPLFQGIAKVESMGLDGIAGTLSVDNRPAACLRSTSGESWLIGPTLLDSAMQMAAVWSRRYLDLLVLPTGFKRLSRKAELRGNEFSVVVSVPEASRTSGELRCDMAIYDAAGSMVVFIEGLSGIGHKSFNRLASQPSASGSPK